MTHKFWIRSILVCFTLMFALVTFGCAAAKAGDTTMQTQALSVPEQGPATPIMLPPELFTGDPNSPYYGKTVVLYPPPGKDVDADGYYANGTPMFHVKTRRSDVVNAHWAGATTSDQAKFDQDWRVLQLVDERIASYVDSLMSMFGPTLQAGLQRKIAPTQADLDILAQQRALNESQCKTNELLQAWLAGQQKK